MGLWFDSLRRACGYCLLPRVFWWSLAPMLFTGLLALQLGWWFWEPALDAVQGAIETWSLSAAALDWLDAVGAGALRAVVAPLLVVALSVPLLLMVSVLAVALFMTRRIARLVAQRRFPVLARELPASSWPSRLASLARALMSLLVALAVLLASVPLWLMPPLALLIPALACGWLAWRVMGFEALVEFASPEQRQQLLREHRLPLLAIGLGSGLLAGAASVLWWLSAAALIYAPWLLVPVMAYYTLVFAFASLWFVHYLLAALSALQPVQTAAAETSGLEFATC